MTFMLADQTVRDIDGAVVPLRSQSSKVLAALIDADGAVVSKDILIDRVWGKEAVSDDSLAQCIGDIRKAIGDTDHVILKTYARKGYMLKPEVSKPARSFHLQAVFAAAAVAFIALIWFAMQPVVSNERARIAVLAFDDLSSGTERGYLSDAISEGIITELARFPQFDTIARNSSFSFREGPRDVREIGSILGARFIIEGSLQKNGNDILVTAQLIDADTAAHIWAETYDETLGDLFEVQAKIVRKVAASVGGKLEAYVPPQGKQATVNAMQLHAEGVSHLQRSTFEEIEKARPFFEAAIKADPSSPYGYLGMGFYYRYVANFAEDAGIKSDAMKKATAMADKAVALAPENYLSHYLKGRLHVLAGELDLATARFSKAATLNPSASSVLVGGSTALLYVGKSEQAIANIRHAMDIDPLHPEWYHWQLGWALWETGDCDAALKSFQKMSVIPEPAYRMMAAVQACQGNIEAAQASMTSFLKARPNASLKKERADSETIWTAPGSLDRWIKDLRLAGMPE